MSQHNRSLVEDESPIRRFIRERLQHSGSLRDDAMTIGPTLTGVANPPDAWQSFPPVAPVRRTPMDTEPGQGSLAAAALTACPDTLLLVRRDGHIVGGQRPLDGPDIPGLRPGPSIRSLQNAFDDEDAALLIAMVNQALDSDDIVEGETRGSPPAGQALEARVTPIGADQALVLLRDITRLRSVERELKDERSGHRHVGLAFAVEQSPVGVMITDAQGHIEYVNPKFSETTGFAAHEVIGKTPDVLRSGVHPPEFYRDLWNTLLAGGTWRGETCNRRKNGTTFWESMSASPVIDATGRISHFVAVKEDITLRRLANQQHAMILRAALDGFWILDGHHRVIEVNDAYSRISLYAPEDVRGRSAEDFVAAEDVDGLRAGLATAAASGADRFEIRHRRLDGSLFEAEMGVQYSDTNGGRFACFVSDVTERNRARRGLETANSALEARVRERTLALEHANAQLRLSEFSLEHAPVGALWADRHGRVLRVNAAAARILGREAGELTGLHVTDFEAVADSARAPSPEDRWSALRIAGLSGHGQTFEIDWRRADAETVPVSVAARWLEFDGQEYWVAFVQDLTAQRLAQRQQLRTQRLQSIGTLAGGIAHDLNNMLAPIVMGIDLLQDDPAVDRKTLDTIASSARYATDVVRQLLTFARGRDGERTRVSLSGLVDELASMIRHSFPKNIVIQRVGTTTLDVVEGNATQLHQVLLNLCVNARDAMQEGGTLTLAIEQLPPAALAGEARGPLPSAFLSIRVEDTGHGIPPDVVDRIFDPFFTTKGPDVGTGLGLSTALGIVHSHGGVLKVSSTPGVGTTFAVCLPAAANQA